MTRFAEVFTLGARLPGQVFREPRGDSLFCEYDVVLAPEIWPALREMARWHGDDRVDLLVLEPGARQTVSAPVGSEGYWSAIGHESDDEFLDSIAVTADVIAVTGPSGKWGCWGERGPEVAVFQGFPDAAAREEWRERFGPFLDAAEAVESYVWMAFGGRRPVPDEYAAALVADYGIG
ncbi:hypothetical protein L3Q65_04235 [Amycolatopsis sp. FU40]|uniref:hypothetical protein n=1 Tax=Amycolatopsis sp. FU40 TaxID=2914159 RepID=UPI001F319076|nr:hypothetical protein [Amycolatopsis sp. FU40]UKD55933.1 hypothetical protein L3Q65_04235 [Amycolatopsis sp. FU40]